MTEYDYRKFKIHYNIKADKTKKNLYTADGYIFCSLDKKYYVPPKQFHTEYTTKAGVQKEIKKLIENYIDFEWQKFYELHGNKIHHNN